MALRTSRNPIAGVPSDYLAVTLSDTVDNCGPNCVGVYNNDTQNRHVNCILEGSLYDRVGSVTVDESGAGYTAVPAVTFTGGGGSGAAGTAVLGVVGANVTAAGSGYAAATTTVTFAGGGGSGATGTAVIEGGEVTGIRITAAGTGYTGVPTITIADSGSGTGATATAVLGVISVTVTNNGSSYESPPVVGFAGDSGAAATAVMIQTPREIQIPSRGSRPGRFKRIFSTDTTATEVYALQA